MYLYNQTHLIDDITTYVSIKSHPLQVWHHSHFIGHHIHSWWQHSIVCMSWHTLCLWHHIYYIWCHPYCVYEYPGSISDLKSIKTAISSTLYVITPSLSKSSHLLCKTSQVAYVCHHMHYTGHHIHTLWQQPLIFRTSHALYSLHHTHYIWQLIYSLWCHIHFVCYIPQWFYDIKHSIFMTYSFIRHHAQCYDHTTIVCIHSHYAWHYTQCILDSSDNEPILWQDVNVSHHSLYIYMTPYALHVTSHPLFMPSHHFI